MSNTFAEYTLTIHRVTGDTLRYKLLRNADEVRKAGNAIENSLAAHHLAIMQEDKLIILPTHQIASIEIEPAPKIKLFVSHIIKDAEPAG